MRENNVMLLLIYDKTFQHASVLPRTVITLSEFWFAASSSRFGSTYKNREVNSGQADYVAPMSSFTFYYITPEMHTNTLTNIS